LKDKKLVVISICNNYLGLAWIIIPFLAFISIKAVVFAGLFDKAGYDFFSHLVLGFALFGFISSVISGGVSRFVADRSWILSTNLPYSLYACTLTLHSLFELGLDQCCGGDACDGDGANTTNPSLVDS